MPSPHAEDLLPRVNRRPLVQRSNPLPRPRRPTSCPSPKRGSGRLAEFEARDQPRAHTFRAQAVANQRGPVDADARHTLNSPNRARGHPPAKPPGTRLIPKTAPPKKLGHNAFFLSKSQ